MSSRKSLSVSKVISYIFLLLLVVAVIGVLGFFTNGFTGEFKTFYVKCGDKTIMERGSVTLPNNEDVRFDVKYTFGIFGSGEKDFSVKVVPKITNENDFEFFVDGEPNSFRGETDWTKAFDIKMYEDYFTINIYNDIYLKDFLSKVYNGKAVEAPEILAHSGYMTLIVTSYNGQASVYIDIGISIAERIIIEGGDIVF